MSETSLFPTFFLSGFECSTFVWEGKGRRDLACETGHDKHLDDDYAMLASVGIAVIREGIPWPFVDRGGGGYDLSRIDPIIEAMNRHKVIPIWDLCHYGYPDHLDPFSPEFAPAFAAYARAAAEYVIPRLHGPHFFTPINEITYFAQMGGLWGQVAPFKRSVEDRDRLLEALCAADIAAVQAIREVESTARMVHIDPMVSVVAPTDRPDLEQKAREEDTTQSFAAWDMLAGMRKPELGGSPEILDIVGVNCFSFGQQEYQEHGKHTALAPDDPRIVPVADILMRVWERYQRPMLVTETSGLHEGRPDWLRDLTEECLAAVNKGLDLHGICLFPAVDMPDWHTGKWLGMGLCDVDPADGLKRIPYQPYIEELRRWQHRLHRVTELDEDPYDTPINLEDIRSAAREFAQTPDADWS